MSEKPDGKVDVTDYLRKIGQTSLLGKFVSVPIQTLIPWDSADISNDSGIAKWAERERVMSELRKMRAVLWEDFTKREAAKEELMQAHPLCIPAGSEPVYLGSGTLPPVNPEISRLRAENEALRARETDISEARGTIEFLERENNRLRQALGRAGQTAAKFRDERDSAREQMDGANKVFWDLTNAFGKQLGRNNVLNAALISAIETATTLAETLAAVLRANPAAPEQPAPVDLVAAVTRDEGKGWFLV